MARKRMIDPNLWMSEDVGKLSVFERLLLIGMFSNADDEGKGRANPPLLRSLIFPYDDIPISDIEKALETIKQNIHVQIYEVDGSKYYKFLNWRKWQKVDKPQPSIIPEPFDEELPNDSPNNHGMSIDEEKRKKEKRKEENIREEKGKEEKDDSTTLSLHVEKITCGKWFISKHTDKLNVLIDMYTYDWVKDALSEAVKKNKYNLNYVEGILKTWAKEGREGVKSGSTGKNNAEGQGKYTGFKPPPPKYDENVDTSGVI